MNNTIIGYMHTKPKY